jgi:hypothetical protein
VSTEDVGGQAADRQHLDADDADEHEIVNAVEQHPENDSEDEKNWREIWHDWNLFKGNYRKGGSFSRADGELCLVCGARRGQ